MHKAYLSILQQEIRPALGCTEPIAVALAVARAREALGEMPDAVHIGVSRNVLKNAMGVGIPGTGMVGLEIAAALSCVAGVSAYGLEVLSDATEADCAQARALIAQGLVTVRPLETEKTLHIEAALSRGPHMAQCVIEDAHTNITRVLRDGEVLMECPAQVRPHPGAAGDYQMTVADIYAFATTVPLEDIRFLKASVDMNEAIAQEGLARDYGMRVGRVLCGEKAPCPDSLKDYAVALTAAAADARMAGCTLPVMSTAGSGNQGITATLPVLATVRCLGMEEAPLLRALALSQMVTIHIKTHIGRLSPLCGCAIAASIGSACAITYLMGGTLDAIHFAVQNMIADISGLICDGAKSGCALKVATSVASALQCAQLALAGVTAGRLDGIIATDVEQSIRNLGNLGNSGMRTTDRVILDMMITK